MYLFAGLWVGILFLINAISPDSKTGTWWVLNKYLLDNGMAISIYFSKLWNSYIHNWKSKSTYTWKMWLSSLFDRRTKMLRGKQSLLSDRFELLLQLPRSSASPGKSRTSNTQNNYFFEKTVWYCFRGLPQAYRQNLNGLVAQPSASRLPRSSVVSPTAPCPTSSNTSLKSHASHCTCTLFLLRVPRNNCTYCLRFFTWQGA